MNNFEQKLFLSAEKCDKVCKIKERNKSNAIIQ